MSGLCRGGGRVWGWPLSNRRLRLYETEALFVVNGGSDLLERSLRF